MVITVEEFARQVMATFLQGPSSVLDTLRKQYHCAHATMPQMSGCGFFINYDVPASADRLGCKSFQLSGIEASIEGLQNGSGFLLFINKGSLDMLEGFTYDEPWPAEISEYSLNYYGRDRNLGKLQKLIG